MLDGVVLVPGEKRESGEAMKWRPRIGILSSLSYVAAPAAPGRFSFFCGFLTISTIFKERSQVVCEFTIIIVYLWRPQHSRFGLRCWCGGPPNGEMYKLRRRRCDYVGGLAQ